MPHTLPEPAPSLKPSIIAAVVMLAIELMRELARWPRSVADVLASTGASRSQAYEMLSRLRTACHELPRPAGRPAAPVEHDAQHDVLCAVRDYLMEQPGAVVGKGDRRDYSDDFRRFVVGLCAPGELAADLTVEQAADAAGVPLGTLKDWLRLPRAEAPVPPDPPTPSPDDDEARDEDLSALAGHPKIATLLAEYDTWKGHFSAFCDHVRHHLRLPYGPTFISTVLVAAGLRQPTRRKKPAPPWSRDSFVRLFPGAQWLGDGTALMLELNGQRFVFNLEAICDVDSGAVTGIHVSDAEDEAALLAAYGHGVRSAGEQPLALTVDSRPSNHTPAVHASVAPTVVLPATPGRGQAKATVEGTFGLFSQTAPPLRVSGHTSRDLARSILALVATTWTWARNGKPRRRLGGLSPAQHYQQAWPSPEQIDAAKAHIAELLRRYERARQTAERRADPVRRALLDEQLRRLGIPDPDGRIAVGLCRYSTDAIVRGLATFAAKREMGTVPADADPARYLGGIIRNLHDRTELDKTAQRLLELRIRQRDLCLDALEADLCRVNETSPPDDRPIHLVQRSLDAERTIDFRFYARAASQALADLCPQTANSLYLRLARQVAGSFSVDKRRREDLIASLAVAVTMATP